MPRKTPILLRRGGLTGRIYALTRYTEKPHPTLPDRTLIDASEKWDVTEDFQRLVLDLMVDGYNPTNLSLPKEDGPIGLDVPVLRSETD